MGVVGVMRVMGAMVALGLSACGSLSGYDSKDSFSCKAPDGVLCASMTGIYANAQQNNLPGQNVHKTAATPDGAGPVTASAVRADLAMTPAISTGTPIRSAPRILRMWFAPWEDSDGDLHDQSFVYLNVDSGKWLIEHTRRRIQDSYRPVRSQVAAQDPPRSLSPQVQTVPSESVTGPGGAAFTGISGISSPAADPTAQIKAELLESLRKSESRNAPTGATCDGNICTPPAKD